MVRRPEILAPAGDRDALAAALASGADAVYLGLDDGFNARARATNFPSSELADVVRWVHRAGARLYVTLNTLVFEPELPAVEELVRRCAKSGVDALIVQDPAVALIAGRYGLEVHASTQMTVSSPLAAELMKPLGLTRVVVPRELSVDDIRAYAAGTSLELEVFVHGALCVAWSGQCLSSEAWGGRSANRGQCAQACRLPYELVVDGEARDLGEVAYLLSPKDLVGLDVVPRLAEAGVRSLKIEGRLKGPAYVAATASQYRRAVEPGWDGAADREGLEVAYSRGVSAGFLAGVDHQTLVEGRFPRHRGVPAGRVVAVGRDSVEIVPDAAQRPVTGGLAMGHGEATSLEPTSRPVTTFEIRAGMGVVFDRGRPEDKEQGGPIFAADRTREGWHLRFGNPGPDLSQVSEGDFVWISSDPRVTKAGDKAVEAGQQPLGRIGVALTVRGNPGEPLTVRARIDGYPHQQFAAWTGTKLEAARGRGIDEALLADKLGAFGGTAFHLASIDASELAPGLHLPVSEIKELRRRLVAQLDDAIDRVEREVPSESVRAALTVELEAALSTAAIAPTAPIVIPLVRDDAQLDAVIAAGAREVELDWMELVGLGRAVERAKAAGVRVGVATVRVQKPGEERIDAHLARLAPDSILVRSWGSLAALRGGARPDRPGPVLDGDFSLNVTNAITARWVLARGLQTVTAAHDLDRDQLFALLDAAPRGRIAVTVHHHIPTFHTEHCVYAHLLSRGRDYRTCGRPCEQHRVSLRDRVGLVHPVVVDVGCRNTVFNAQAQSAAAMVPELLARGVTRLRIELVRETAAEARRVYAAYAGLVAGTTTPAEVARTVAAHEQFGVTRGTMRTLTVLT